MPRYNNTWALIQYCKYKIYDIVYHKITTPGINKKFTRTK